MTEPSDFLADDSALPLPGLDDAPRGTGDVEAAARRTLAALPELDDRHAVVMQALLTAARQLDAAATSGRAKPYGVAELLVQLRELFLVLMPEDEGGTGGDDFDKLADELRDAARMAR